MKIKLFAMDVDGTMTDGKIYIGGQGEMMKAFNVKDGMGIKLLRDSGVMPAIITARQSDIVAARAKELGITEVYQGKGEKAEVLKGICDKHGFSPDSVVFVGDDLPDLPAMEYAAYSLCPCDAVKRVREAATQVMPSAGGNGAIRDAAEWVLEFNSQN